MEKKSKITTPIRIRRVLEKMCNAHMSIIMKTDSRKTTGVRGQLTHVADVDGKEFIFVTDVSERGKSLLKGEKSVKVEVQGMPSRVVFLSKIQKRTDMGIRLDLPKKIVSVERRQNARLPMATNYTAYLRTKGWTPKVHDLAAPPLITPFEHLASLIALADISVGGACIMSHFPAATFAIEGWSNPIEGSLILPMNAPIDLKFNIRWKKKTTNRVIDDGLERARLEFRLGIEFEEPTEDLVIKLRAFMRQLSLAQAI